MNVENTTVCDSDDTRDNAWSDEYFTRKYCNVVPNYEKPSRDLLVRAIHAFLNFYVFGLKQMSTQNIEHVWLILLHGVKFKGNYLQDRKDTEIFGGGGDKVPLPDIETSSQISVRKYAPCYMKQKGTNEVNSQIWEWKYSFFEDGTVVENVITSETVKKWYQSCWEIVVKCKEDEFQDYVRYFAMLSMILFRVIVKQPVAVEKYIGVRFNKTFRAFCTTLFMPSAVPPHASIYRFIRNKVFKRGGPNYTTYLTYLVGTYAFCERDARKVVRDYLNAGCMQIFSCVGTGAIYWLRKAADQKNMKSQELLKFFTIDPSMETKVKRLDKFIETYRKDVTWWWARLFEKNALSEISTADCPAFAYACFIINAVNEKKITKGSEYAQFSRFIEKGDQSSLTGKNLGTVLKNVVNEWNTTPLSQLTKSLLTKIELEKCVDIGLKKCVDRKSKKRVKKRKIVIGVDSVLRIQGPVSRKSFRD
jgi:hypothetical protein